MGAVTGFGSCSITSMAAALSTTGCFDPAALRPCPAPARVTMSTKRVAPPSPSGGVVVMDNLPSSNNSTLEMQSLAKPPPTIERWAGCDGGVGGDGGDGANGGGGGAGQRVA